MRNTYEKSLFNGPETPMLLRIGTSSSLSEPDNFSFASSLSICRNNLLGDCFSEDLEFASESPLEPNSSFERRLGQAFFCFCFCSSSSSLELSNDFCLRMAMD